MPGVWAFGDAANHFQLKHMANAEERGVLHNLGQTVDQLGHHVLYVHPALTEVLEQALLEL